MSWVGGGVSNCDQREKRAGETSRKHDNISVDYNSVLCNLSMPGACPGVGVDSSEQKQSWECH